jgi:cytochrome P450
VHYCAESEFGPYWSVTKYKDIMAVETRHQIFSSEPAIILRDPDPDFTLPMFIAMDPPKHDIQRKAVSPIVAPANLANFEGIIRQRAGVILDQLPVGETFDWVDRVSIELTTQMLATLFDFPWEDRRKRMWRRPRKIPASSNPKRRGGRNCMNAWLISRICGISG